MGFTSSTSREYVFARSAKLQCTKIFVMQGMSPDARDGNHLPFARLEFLDAPRLLV